MKIIYLFLTFFSVSLLYGMDPNSPKRLKINPAPILFEMSEELLEKIKKHNPQIGSDVLGTNNQEQTTFLNDDLIDTATLRTALPITPNQVTQVLSRYGGRQYQALTNIECAKPNILDTIKVWVQSSRIFVDDRDKDKKIIDKELIHTTLAISKYNSDKTTLTAFYPGPKEWHEQLKLLHMRMKTAHGCQCKGQSHDKCVVKRN